MEVHAELLTRSKMFCSCSADFFGVEPNTLTCPVCTGMPGVLPVINQKAVEYTIMTAPTLNCEIAEATIEVFQTLKRRGHPDAPPPTVSDGSGGIREAMAEVYGKEPDYSGTGRPLTKKRPQPGWKCLQVVKQRKKGSVVGTRLRVVYGDKTEVLELLRQSTAYVERTHLTMRHFNSRLIRKTLGYSKIVEMHKAAAAWEDIVHNLVHRLKTLRLEISNGPVRRWLPRTLAMAAGLTDRIWTVKGLLKVVSVPSLSNT